MANYTLPNTTDFYNLYTLTGISVGKSLLVYNKGVTSGYIRQGEGVAESINTEYPVKHGVCVMIQGHDNQNIYIRGVVGEIVVQPLVSTTAPFTFIDLPHYLYTSAEERYRRLRVDVAQTGFFEGREGRTFYEFSIPSSTTRVIKAVVPVDTILHDLTVIVDNGSLRITTVVGGTEGGVFSTALPAILKNNMTARPTPYYTLQNTLSTGGTHTGGIILDVVRVVASSATAQRSSVGGSISSERGIATGTYYFRLENFGSGDVTGVFSGWWEERPLPNF